MTAYIIRRLLLALLVLLIVSIMIFLALRLLPGDPVLMYITSDKYATVSQEEIDAVRHQEGLDRPIAVQYLDWIAGVAHGDLGTSIVQRKSVGEILGERIPISLHLGLLSFILFNLIGIPAGVICAIRHGKWLDTFVTLIANVGITAPVFWLGILMIYVFGLYLKWLPIFGYTSPFTDFWMSTKQLIMPVLCLCIFPIASTVRQTRSSMLEVMHQDYIRTAWSKGLRERLVVAKHALKNGLIPVVTLTGLGISNIIGGSVLVETVFNIPGMGRLAVSAVLSHDYPVVQGVVLIIASIIVLVNLLVDLSYSWLDPRIRYA